MLASILNKQNVLKDKIFAVCFMDIFHATYYIYVHHGGANQSGNLAA